MRGRQLAGYLHVDDTLVMGDGSHAGITGKVMEELANGSESLGFLVPERLHDHQLEKVVGYSIDRRPAAFRLHLKKAAQLQDGLRRMVAAPMVRVDSLRSVIGVWIWGSLLRRELLSVPHSVFKFMDRCAGKCVRWWATARSEVQFMATLVAFMKAEVGAPLSPVLFASDAQGSGEGDHGGWGVVAMDIDMSTAEECLLVGLRPGLSISKLSGVFRGMKRPDLQIRRSTPFTKLPRHCLDADKWHAVASGRWVYSDHVTLGESRAVNKILDLLRNHGACHEHKVLALQDNMATSGAYMKGRSPAPALNFLLRKRAGRCLAVRIQLLLPWV